MPFKNPFLKLNFLIIPILFYLVLVFEIVLVEYYAVCNSEEMGTVNYFMEADEIRYL